MRVKRLFRDIISMVLCVCILLQMTPIALATEESVVYVKDIKLIYAENATEAAKKVPDGYILYKQDINEGTDELGVYICYSTTTDETQAITDIRVMNENGNFDRGTFNDKMDQALDILGEQADAIHKALLNEFIPNLNKGLPGAVYAYEQLNIFMFDEDTALGDYIKSGQITSSDIAKMLLVCHNTVLSAVLSLIAQGLQREDGQDWLDKLESMDPAEYEMNAALQTQYAELINRFQGPMSAFSDQYNIMVYTDEVRDSMTPEQVALYSEDLANEEMVQWWYTLWSILNAHMLAGDSGMSAEYLFVEWNLGEGVANYKICMVLDALTEGQRTLMQLVGPVNFIMSDIFTEEARLKAQEGLAPLKAENGQLSLWSGVDTGIFDAEVGITSEAYDEMATSANYDIFTQENDILEPGIAEYVSFVTNYGTLVSGAITLVAGVTIIAKGFAHKFVVCKVLGYVGALITKSLVGMVITYAAITVTCVCLLISLVIWIIKEIQAGKPPAHDRTTIPKYMVDSVVDSYGAQVYKIYQRVDNVQSDSDLKKEDWDLSDVTNMSGADINANKGYHWAALYVSHDEAVGNPIEADFVISTDLDLAPEGYIAMRPFNRKSEAADLNGVDEYNGEDQNLYCYFKSELLPEDHRVYKYIRQIQAVSVDLRDPSDPDKYRFSTEEALAVAKKQLTGAAPSYYVIDHNFSNDPNVVTLIGWNGTNNADDAIKDIRLVYKSSVPRAGAGNFGSINYANMGTINDWSLFVCRTQDTEMPPVTMLKFMRHGEDPSTQDGLSLNMDGEKATLNTDGEKTYGFGWEPVNTFSGGNAIPLGPSGIQFYYMPEKTFTEGADYLAGIVIDAYITNEGFHEGTALQPVEDCCHVDIWDNQHENYRTYKETELGEHFFEDFQIVTAGNLRSAVSLSSNRHAYVTNNPNCPYIGMNAAQLMNTQTTTAVKYYLTKNPYRAIYGLAMRSDSDDNMRNSFMAYDGYGYALSPVEATVSVSGIYMEEFGYEELLKSGKTFSGKTLVLDDNPYHSEGIVVNQDITQISWPYNDIRMNNLYASGYSADRSPLTVEDVFFSDTHLQEDQYPDNFISVPHMGGSGTEVESIAPFVEKVRVKLWDYSTVISVNLFKDFYCYFKSEVGTGDNVTTYQPGQGKYISSLILASKEKIRVEALLPKNKDAECENIAYTQLTSQLINSGATTTYDVNIGTDYYEDGDDNANTIYLGVTRTNDADLAIRDIRFLVCPPTQTPQERVLVEMEINGVKQCVEYHLVDDVSLTSKANLECQKEVNSKGMEVWKEKELLQERQAYLYVCYNKTAFPHAITDIQITDWCSFGAFEPVLSFAGETIYTVQKQNSVDLHVTDEWFESGDMFSFKREGNRDLYVSELAIRNGKDENQVISSLVEAGYSVVNKDMNETAAGDHIYIGCKYTDDPDNAITDVMTIHTKSKYDAYSVTDEKHIYSLVADIDLNKGAGGSYIYLYYTKDSRAGSPLLELYGTESIVNHTDSLYNHKTVRRLWDFAYSNLNAGTTIFTDDIYLVMKRAGNNGKYISDVMVVYGWSESGAKEKLREAGYLEYVDKDLNDGTGSSQWIYLGYKRTDDPKKAIRNLLIYHQSEPTTRTHQNAQYTLVSDVNLNRHCHAMSDDLFMYYTRDAAAGYPITALYVNKTPVEYKKDEQGYHKTVQGGTGFGATYIDLNRTAGGDYIYLVMVSQPPGHNTTQSTTQNTRPQTYTLSVVDGTSERAAYAAGESVTVTAHEDATKIFTGWTATGIKLDAQTAAKTEITFTMPANHVSLTANFVQKTYNVQLPEGAVFVDGGLNKQFAPGTKVQILWNDPETHLVDWNFSQQVDGDPKQNPMTFTMPATELVIGADTFAKTNAVTLELAEPVAGKPLPTSVTFAVNDVVFTANVTWYDGETEVTIAERGKTYRAVIAIAESAADGIVFSENGTATVNGIVAESWETVDGGMVLNISAVVTQGDDMLEIVGSMIGNGSWIAIVILILGLAATVVITCVIHKKRNEHSEEPKENS